MSRIIFYLMAILIAFTAISCASTGGNVENCITGTIYVDSPMKNCSFETNLSNVYTQDNVSDESNINEDDLFDRLTPMMKVFEDDVNNEVNYFKNLSNIAENFRDNNTTTTTDLENETSVSNFIE